MSSVQISPEKTGQDRTGQQRNRTADLRRRIRFLALKGIVTSDTWADGAGRGHRMVRMRMHGGWYSPPMGMAIYCVTPLKRFSAYPLISICAVLHFTA